MRKPIPGPAIITCAALSAISMFCAGWLLNGLHTYNWLKDAEKETFACFARDPKTGEPMMVMDEGPFDYCMRVKWRETDLTKADWEVRMP